jgi:hypothetical protein
MSSKSHTVFRTPLIAKPYIESCSGHFEGWCKLGVMHDPTIGGIEESVLEENNWFALVLFCRNPKESEEVTISRYHSMIFK